MAAATAADLDGLPLFAGLDADELRELALRFEVKDVSAGVRLVGEGATGYSFFVLVDGSVSVTAGGAEVAALGRGDFFGELALLGSGRRQATVTTTTPGRVLVMFGTEFRALEQEHPAVAAEIEAAMERRAAELRRP